MDNENPRIKKVENFLLDPDKVMFESVTELEQATNKLLEIFSTINVEELEKLEGYTPVFGVDYMTDEELNMIQEFITERLPVSDVDFPSIDSVGDYIQAQVALIPLQKGDKGKEGDSAYELAKKDGFKGTRKEWLETLIGKQGSPDSGKDILSKIRNVKKDGLKISDVKGLPKKITLLNETSDDVEQLKEKFSKFKSVLPMIVERGAGDVSTVTGSDSIDIDNTDTSNPIASLVNDQATPGNSKYYGTDAGGTKGYHTLTTGGGSVDSVNTQTGVVVLDTDDIAEGTNKYVTAGDITKLGNLSGTNTGDQVGDGVTITGAGTALDPFVSAGGGGGSGPSNVLAAPQKFTPTTGASDTFTLSNSNSVGVVTLNGQVLAGNEYSLAGLTLTVTPVVGFVTGDEVLVFQNAAGTVLTQKTNKVISGATYTLLDTDIDKILIFTNATGCTVTVPTGLTAGNRYEGKQRGDGQVTFVGAVGVTVNTSATDTLKTADKFSVFGLDSYSATEYDLYGKLELV